MRISCSNGTSLKDLTLARGKTVHALDKSEAHAKLGARYHDGGPHRRQREVGRDAMNDVTERPSRFPLPPIIFLAALVFSVLMNVLYPLPWLGQPLSGVLFVIGWMMLAAFVALSISAMRVMRRAGTTVRPDRATAHLVTDGPFSFTRNPLYLAGTMLLLGIGLVSGIVWFLLLAILAAFALQKLAIEREERHLQARFGDRYLDYARRIRRWI
jgi:protein-S-isoprenylcysteine O-methyltransferase Ste14